MAYPSGSSSGSSFEFLLFGAHCNQGRGGSAVTLVLQCRNLWETEQAYH